jgi:mevalonate kinase
MPAVPGISGAGEGGKQAVVVTNHNRTSAIVIRYDGATVTLVPMKGGKLLACTIPFTEFRTEWQETSYALDKALEIFLQHVAQEGATSEVVKGLTKLKQRDEQMACLF